MNGKNYVTSCWSRGSSNIAPSLRGFMLQFYDDSYVNRIVAVQFQVYSAETVYYSLKQL